MLEPLHNLSEWLLGLADSRWAIAVLGITSFAESIFFPIPPDPVLLVMSIAQPTAALWFAALVTVASVAGALVGHWLGQRFGRPFAYRMFSEHRITMIESMFRRYGMLAVLIAAFTPLPYKVFAIAAGILALDRRTFVIASLVGRGARFFLLGGLVFIFGEPIAAFINEKFGLLTLGVPAAIVAAVVTTGILYGRRRARSDAQDNLKGA